MGKYVIGDIHACFDEWIRFKDRIESVDKQASFILIGDIVDRGPKEEEMLRWAMANVTGNGKYQMIMGNHEYDRIDFERNPYVAAFFACLPIYKDIMVNGRRFILVHASLPESVVLPDGTLKMPRNLSGNERYLMVWSRDLAPFTAIKDATVIHGHNPTTFEDTFRPEDFTKDKLGRVYNLGNRINIDCGVVFDVMEGHRLAALRLDDMKVFYNDDPVIGGGNEIQRVSPKDE